MSNRGKIMEAAVRLFARVGYDATTVEDLLRETGVARSNFYYHFEDKRDLSLALVGRWAEGWAAAIDELSRAEADRAESVRRLMALARGAGPPETAPHVTLVALETAAHEERAREQVLSVLERLSSALGGAGTAPRGQEVEAAGELVLAAVLGSSVLARAAPGADRLERIEAAAVRLQGAARG